MSLDERLIVSKQNYQIPGELALSSQERQLYPRKIIVSSLFAEFVPFREDFPFSFFDSFPLFQSLETCNNTQRVTGEDGRQLLCQVDKVSA